MTDPDNVREPERIVCDTNIVSILDTAQRKRSRIEHWPNDAVARLDQAILAISVVTFAELRSGHNAAGYSFDTVQRKLEIIGSYLLLPLDMQIVERWAKLDPQRKPGGWGIDDNDLWIIATAQTREWPVVSCDAGYRKVPDLDVIYLPSKRDSPQV